MMRAKAMNSFDVDFFKLLSNSHFGKTIKREGLVSIAMKCLVLKLDKPSYIGCAILELSRLFMSCFHYDFMVKKISKDRLHLLYMDTDSL